MQENSETMVSLRLRDPRLFLDSQLHPREMLLLQSSEESGRSTGVILSAEAPQAALLEDGSQDDPDFAPATPTAEQPVEEGPALPLANLSAKTRQANFRQQQVAMLNDIAEKILEQGKKDRDKAMRQINILMQKEDQIFQSLLENGRRDRIVFQEVMQQNMTVMTAAVDALRSLGYVFRDIQRSIVALQERGLPCLSSQGPASLPQFGTPCENRSSNTTSICHAQTEHLGSSL